MFVLYKVVVVGRFVTAGQKYADESAEKVCKCREILGGLAGYGVVEKLREKGKRRGIEKRWLRGEL